ncbi:ATP-dependent helicase [Clostridium tyrobutyricum]|uniref:UvrD-helicase domain-containing protein n=1 Tax=Clostridium tyrobutyricum TaxID=1519 RepID=UPI001C38BAAF|nr:ATP-dependent helicase [Clostridium tyrobutyricum]MBV4420181.1 ATP-dependent helicase [Clostridium tyrobutyricum]
MNKIIRASEWKPADNIIYSDESEEMKIIKCNKNCLVSAGPGAGKTELLSQKASFLLQTNKCTFPRKILALTFKRDASDNLKNRVDIRCGHELSNRFVSSTYDSFFTYLLSRFFNLVPSIYKPSDDYNIIIDNKIIINAYESAGYDLKKLSIPKRKFCTNFYLTENRLPVNDSNYEEPAKRVWNILLHDGDESQISFKMASRLVEYIIKLNPMIKKLLQLTYSHVFLDEFQDTNVEQYNTIKTCFQNTSTIITAVGDKKQTIMKWAGAVPEIFQKFKKDFSSNESTLLVNHRSVPELIKFQNIIIEEMIKDKLNIRSDNISKELQGICQEWYFNNEDDEAIFLSKKIELLIKEELVDKNEICILTRNLPVEYCNKLIGKLSELNIDSRVENDYQNLLREDLVKIVLSILKLSIDKSNPDDWTFIVKLLKKISGYNSYTKEEKLKSLERDIYTYLKKINKLVSKNINKDEFKKLINSIVAYLGVASLKALYPQYKKGKYMDNTINSFINLFWENYDTTKDMGKSIEKFIGEDTISIMSIHKSKGLEFNTVIVLGVENSAFWGIKNNFDEELCNFFVAVSRAKQRLFFTCSNERIIRGKTIIGKKDDVKLFHNLMKKSEIVEFYDLVDNFNKVYSEYYDCTKDVI